MDAIRMLVVGCCGPTRALPAGPEADRILAQDALDAQKIGPAVAAIAGFREPIAMERMMLMLAGMGIRPGEAMASIGPLGATGAFHARILLEGKSGADARRLAARLGAIFGADKTVAVEAANAPSNDELAAIFESWELERASAIPSSNGKAAARI